MVRLPDNDMLYKIGRLNDYAHGGYACKCMDCRSEFEGDKRARQCLPCAITTMRAAFEESEKECKILEHQNDALQQMYARVKKERDQLQTHINIYKSVIDRNSELTLHE